jgi:hypothetical protein
MSGLGDKQRSQDQKSRQPEGELRVNERPSRDERNCAQWFARYEDRCANPPMHRRTGEVRRLREELEALRRLVTGEQIP